MKSLPTAGQRLRSKIATAWIANTVNSVIVYSISTTVLFFSAPAALSVGLIFAIPAAITFGMFATIAMLSTFSLAIGFRSEAAANKKIAEIQQKATDYYQQNLQNAKSSSFAAEYGGEYKGDFSHFFDDGSAPYEKNAEEKLCGLLSEVMGYDITQRVTEQENVKKTVAEMVQKKTDPFKIVGVGRYATDDQIKKAYRKKSLLLHPDRNPGNTEQASSQFSELNEANTLIEDQKARTLTLAILDNPNYNFLESSTFKIELASKLAQHPQGNKLGQDIVKLTSEIQSQHAQNFGGYKASPSSSYSW